MIKNEEFEQASTKSSKTAAGLSAQIDSQSQELTRLKDKVKVNLETLQQREAEMREVKQSLEESTQQSELTQEKLKQAASKLVRWTMFECKS